ncbi:MAG: hypothetical protein E7635_03575 [Ruminococcaceae bacterium]|nr:hypothetical protein [Oscillospiraceae bacterium]
MEKNNDCSAIYTSPPPAAEPPLKGKPLEGSEILKDIDISKYAFVMCQEPSPDLTIEKANEIFDKIETEKDIANLFAVVHNKAWWIEDEEYDFDEGTGEYRKAVEKTDMWFSLADKLKDMIFDILKSEGIEVPDKGQIVVLEPFMKRNGFKDGQGWWIKE